MKLENLHISKSDKFPFFKIVKKGPLGPLSFVDLTMNTGKREALKVESKPVVILRKARTDSRDNL